MGLLCNYSVWVLSICTYIPFIPVISRPSTMFQFSLKNIERLLGKSSAWEIFVILLGQLQSSFVTLRCAEGINRSLKQHVMFLKKYSKPYFSQQFRYQCVGLSAIQVLDIQVLYIQICFLLLFIQGISRAPSFFHLRFSRDLPFCLCEANSVKIFVSSCETVSNSLSNTSWNIIKLLEYVCI